MSTRAIILIKSKKQKEEVRIYHRYDGYPEGVGHDLKEYLKGVKRWYVYDIANELIKGKCGNKNGGYELTLCQHGDENYAYLIDCDAKEIICYKVGWDEFEWKDEKIVERWSYDKMG